MTPTHSYGRRATRVLAAALAAGLLVASPAVAAASGAPAYSASWRGTLIDAVAVQHLDRAQVTAALNDSPFDSSQVRYGVDAYRIVYATIDPQGRRTTATGLVVLPRNGTGPLRVVSYAHGTRTGRVDVASRAADNPDRAATLEISSAGFAAVAPDYLGLGYGPGYHPYMDAASETTASLDMLRAARTLAAQQHRQLDPRILVTGFSQGGQAAMALGRALQEGADPSMRLAGIAGISGPYDGEHAELPGALVNGSVAPQTAAFYLAYWTVSMNRLHHFYSSPSEVFQAPYDKTVAGLFDGQSDEEVIFPALPATPQELFTDAYLQRLLHPSGKILQALRENDDTCSSWRPAVPVRLYAASGDTDVPIKNSENCRDQFRAHGVDVPLIDVGDVTHEPSGFRSLPQVVAWFRTLARR